jgi:glycosyltransferase involved in cell wall biosynthesis
VQIKEDSRSLKIAIDGLQLFPPFTGLQRTLILLIRALGADPSNHLLVFAPKDVPGDLGFSPNVEIHRTGFKGAQRLRRLFFRHFSMMRLSYKYNAGLFHGPCYYLPMSMSLPSVVTVHDLIALTHSNLVSDASRRLFARALPASLKRATRIVTPTRHVKDQLVGRMKIDPSKVDVVPWYADGNPGSIGEHEKDQLRRQMSLPEKFILFVGRLERKKNLPALIKSFWAMQMAEHFPHKLIICGPPGNATNEIEHIIQTLAAAKSVVFTGYLEDNLLDKVYQLADAVAVPSLEEGFGLTALEAMARGTPVICSDIPALREICGDAASYALPPDLKAWRGWLTKICAEPKSFTRQISDGLKRVKLFNEKSYAAAMGESYRKTLADFRS